MQHCKELDKRFYELTLKSLCYLIFVYAEKNKVKQPFSSEKKLADQDLTDIN